MPFYNLLRNSFNREDDTNWPKKNIVGKQELEIRIGNDHIAFEVSSPGRYLRFRRWLTLAFADRKNWVSG